MLNRSYCRGLILKAANRHKLDSARRRHPRMVTRVLAGRNINEAVCICRRQGLDIAPEVYEVAGFKAVK